MAGFTPSVSRAAGGGWQQGIVLGFPSPEWHDALRATTEVLPELAGTLVSSGYGKALVADLREVDTAVRGWESDLAELCGAALGSSMHQGRVVRDRITRQITADEWREAWPLPEPVEPPDGVGSVPAVTAPYLAQVLPFAQLTAVRNAVAFHTEGVRPSVTSRAREVVSDLEVVGGKLVDTAAFLDVAYDVRQPTLPADFGARVAARAQELRPAFRGQRPRQPHGGRAPDRDRPRRPAR